MSRNHTGAEEQFSRRWLVPINDRLRLDIIQRAEGMCEMVRDGTRCGAPGVDLHHIIPRRKFSRKRRKERDDPVNIQYLCYNCHYQKHHGGRALG